VFVVGYLGDWRAAAAVLFERHSLQGHPAPSREKREDPAKCLTRGAGQRYDFETEDLIPQPIALAENTIGRQPQNGGNGDGFADGGPMYTLNATGVHGVAQPVGAFKPGQSAQAGIGYATSVAPTLEAGGGGNNKPAVHIGMAVRRLTPVECERLQGFPDSYTDIKSKNKPTPDGPRYKALGNSMAVPVMAWIGQRIEQVEAICKQNK
jgi:DNA (cytosine-5)-methyltransferase 1